MRILIDSTPIAVTGSFTDMLVELAMGVDDQMGGKSVVVTDDAGRPVLTGVLSDFKARPESCYA